ncbi:hypothetical protein Tco_1521162, partial [Tanacetum coccineum]
AAAAVRMGVRVQRKMEGDGGHGKILWLDNSDDCEDGLVTEDMEIGEEG